MNKYKFNIRLILFLVTLILPLSGKAQDYKNLGSFKTGYTTGFSYKRLFENESALSAHLDFKDRGLALSTFRTFHQLAFPEKSYKFFFYYGYGAHFRYYGEYTINNPFKPWRPRRKFYGNFFGAGVDGIVGLEYRFLKYPFVASAEYNPNLEFGGANFFRLYANQVSFAIGYTF